MSEFHQPVLLNEAIEYLAIKKGSKYIDATVGGGGHAQAILKLEGKILGLDCDPEAIARAREYLSTACPVPTICRNDNASWRLARGNFKDLSKIAKRAGFTQVDGVLFDLGVSSYQLETPQRGFSFSSGVALDMRMDPDLEVTAADLINGLTKNELEKLFSKISQEHYSRRIAEAICRARRIKPIETCNELAEIIVKARPKRERFDRTHPATRCFQALRIAVNDELNNLKKALPQAVNLLKPKGRLVLISFHSGEDRIVKQFLRESEKKGKIRIITKKPIRPTQREVKRNPQSRSAKLRVGER